MDTEFSCDCGNTACRGLLNVRKGYVNIAHDDGREEERWDYLWLDVYQGADKELANCELVFPPAEARRLMWFLIRAYMPVICHIDNWYQRNIVSRFFIIRVWFSDLLDRMKS